ncbi:MAG TPA: SCO family protein [Steroidobacteraceae bacterium]|nr:SCO family protein [Steroidobacteraceae bacterium]
MNARRPRTLARMGLALVSMALVFVASVAPAGASQLPALKAGVFDPPRQAPEFSLQGSNGAELKMSAFRGKVVLLAFGFTSCTEVCPTTLAVFADARRKLGPAASDVQVLYITVDPERDVPERMKKYLAGFDKSFIGGTGSPAQLAAVRKDYGISAEKKMYGSDYTYVHSSFVYLIDRRGRIRALMPYGHSPDDYVHDLKILLGE